MSDPGWVHSTTFYPELRNEFKIFPNLGGVHSTTSDPELRNERFILISFMGIPAILSALQPFQICIFNRKYSKLTFSNGPQLMGKGLWQIYIHHWTVHAKVEFQKCPPDVRSWGVHSTTFYPELRNEFKFFFNLGGGVHSTTFDPDLWNKRFTLKSFMKFPAILSTLQPFQICIFNRKYSKLTFQMTLSWWGWGLWQIYMHHWTVHAKVEFQKCPPDIRARGFIPQLWILKSEMKLKFFPAWGGPFHNFWYWTQKWI